MWDTVKSEKRYIDAAPLIEELNETLDKMREELERVRRIYSISTVRKHEDAIKALEMFLSTLYNAPVEDVKLVKRTTLSKGIANFFYCNCCNKLTRGWAFCENCGAEIVSEKEAAKLKEKGIRVYGYR